VRKRVQTTAEAIEWTENDNEDAGLWGLTLATLSRGMGVHRVTVTRRLRRATGLTWREQKSRRTEKKAKQLLRDSRLSVKEVAYMLKFRSASAFSRFFLRRTGVRPSKWGVDTST
jgi:AraC-like DNA-binding protein